MPTILVVDDDNDLRGEVAHLLTDAGFDVRIAANGAKALEVLEEADPDLIVTDLVMPGTDGLELITDLRRSGRTTPVVAISSGGMHGTDTYLAAAEAFGANAILRKPFRAAQLINLVKQHTPCAR